MATHTPQQRLVLWVIWFALFSSVFVYRIYLGGETDAEGAVDAVLLGMLIGPTAVAVFIRWFLLPKARDVQQTLVLAIIGMALAESVVFYGLFLFPPYQDLFFAVSVLGVFQFIPIYAHRREIPARGLFGGR